MALFAEAFAFGGPLPALPSRPMSGGRRATRDARERGVSSALAAATAVAAGVLAKRRAASSRGAVLRKANVTGPGWTDELARLFDPRVEGPDWEPELGYCGRPRLRLLLDAEDICHSYAKARYMQTGEWTGPLSDGIAKALDYGAWGGGDVEEVDPDRGPNDPDMTPPEILTFVGMPSDLIEALKPGDLVDGFPEDTRQEIGNVVLSEDGFFINAFLRSLQDDDRLITWHRPARQPGGIPRVNALMAQKYYEPSKVVPFRFLSARPILLNQAMGGETGLEVGARVEALKPGRFFKDTWIPSMWKPAIVAAANYDGTYDLQFEMNHGPYRERRTKGHKRTPTLSLRKNERFKDFGADHMPASFRLFEEMNYQQSVPPSNIRMVGFIDRISDMHDPDATQDWYLCTSKKFMVTESQTGRDAKRLDDFARRFLFSYRWVPTEDGDLRFEPVPNASQAQSLRVCHKNTAMQFASAASADDEAKRKIKRYKAEMAQFEQVIGEITAQEHKPRRPAGPRKTRVTADA